MPMVTDIGQEWRFPSRKKCVCTLPMKAADRLANCATAAGGQGESWKATCSLLYEIRWIVWHARSLGEAWAKGMSHWQMDQPNCRGPGSTLNFTVLSQDSRSQRYFFKSNSTMMGPGSAREGPGVLCQDLVVYVRNRPDILIVLWLEQTLPSGATKIGICRTKF